MFWAAWFTPSLLGGYKRSIKPSINNLTSSVLLTACCCCCCCYSVVQSAPVCWAGIPVQTFVIIFLTFDRQMKRDAYSRFISVAFRFELLWVLPAHHNFTFILSGLLFLDDPSNDLCRCKVKGFAHTVALQFPAMEHFSNFEVIVLVSLQTLFTLISLPVAADVVLSAQTPDRQSKCPAGWISSS